MARKQTLFYADAVNILRSIYKPRDYTYREDFNGDLIILRNNDHLITVEIKSEREVKRLSTLSGRTFEDLRRKINSLNCFSERGSGKYKGWLAILAQCWDYMQNGLPTDINGNSFAIRDDILVIPYNKKAELKTALQKLSLPYDSNMRIPRPKVHDYPADNMSVLIYDHESLNLFFDQVRQVS